MVACSSNIVLSWTKSVLLANYPRLADKREADLNGDKVTQQNEKLAGADLEAYAKFLDLNRPVLARNIPFIGYGEKLKTSNIIHQLFYLESDCFSPEEIKQAYQQLTEIISQIKEVLSSEEYRGLSDKEKIIKAYEILNSKYKFVEQTSDTSLTGNLLRGVLDCDTAAFVILALADEMGWEVSLIQFPKHILISCKNGLVDEGKEYSKGFYMKKFSMSESETEKFLIPLTRCETMSVFYANRAIFKYRRLNFDGAAADYNEAIKNRPDYYVYYLGRGAVFAEAKRFQTALNDFNKAIELAPSDDSCWSGRGLVNYCLGNAEAALEDFTQAIKLNPRAFLAYYYRSKVREVLGDQTGAREDYDRAMMLRKQ